MNRALAPARPARAAAVVAIVIAVTALSSCGGGHARPSLIGPNSSTTTTTSPPATATNQYGYIPVSGGVQLAYDLTLPAASGRFPVALEYDDYGVGEDNDAENSGTDAADLLAAGFAVLGVNQPGSGCSSGVNNIADVNEWGRAGAQVVEWAAAQPWSTGHVGMFGSSWTGITQIGIAGFRPRGLDAIAPFHVATDIYRDAAYLGGVYDNAFMGQYATRLTQTDAQTAAAGIHRGDPECAGHYHAHATANAPYSIATGTRRHPYDDAYYATSPGEYASRIDIPILGCQSWQDGLVSSRATALYYDTFAPTTTWFIGMNGGHGSCEFSTPLKMMVDFLRYYVAGSSDGWPATPHVTLLHDVKGSGSSQPEPAWTSTYGSWTGLMKPVSLYFQPDRSLSAVPPGPAGPGPAGPGPAGHRSEPAASFSGPSPSQSGPWTAAPAATSLVYTSPPLAADADVFGPGSVNLWLSSTRPDTAIEVIISEVRPDGQEQYVQAGWLDVAQRALAPTGDAADQSSALRPFQTHTLADRQPLTPGQPVYARVELLPFEHVFRRGSSIRITIDTASGPVQPGGSWGLAGPGVPFVDTVYAGPSHPSAVVLGLIPGATAAKPLPSCHDTLAEPCRVNATPVPAGTLVLPPS